MTRHWYMPPRHAAFKVEGQPPWLSNRWFQTWVLKLRNMRTGELTEERCISIKLPVFGYYYSINTDAERWGQLTFQYRGQRGWFFAPIFSADDGGTSSAGKSRPDSGGPGGFTRG